MRTRLLLVCVTMLAAAAAFAQSQPQFFPNSQKYRDEGKKPSTGRSGSASLTVRALLGKDGQTDLEMTTGVLDSPSTYVGNISKVQVKVLRRNGVIVWSKYNDLEVGGYFKLTFSEFQRGAPLQVQANIRGIDPNRTDVVTVQQPVHLRPDLAVSGLTMPVEAVVNTAVNIAATVQESNRDVGANADCLLLVDNTEVDRAGGIWVDAGGSVSCAFTHTFTATGTRQVRVKLDNAVPSDFDSANNSVAGSIEVRAAHNLAYNASVYDREFRDTGRYTNHYRFDDGHYDALYDYENAWDQSGWDQSVWIGGWRPQALVFPLVNFTAIETNDGATVASISMNGLAATWTNTWTNGGNSHSEACVQAFDASVYGWFQVCAYLVKETLSGNVVSEMTNVYYNRYAGEVTYHSSGFDRYWSRSQGTQWYYTWNYDSANRYGTRRPVGSNYGIEISVSDGTRTLSASPVIAVTPFDYSYSQPFTCFERFEPNLVQRYCEGRDYSASGKQGYATAPLP